MDLLVVRHAIAEARGAFARSVTGDGERPLTAVGRRRFERGARGLKRLVPELDVVAASPLRRAAETAELLAEAYGGARGARPVRVDALAPDADPADLLAWLRRQPARARVAVVGHEPHLSAAIALLLAGRGAPFLALRKGGACLLALPRRAAPGSATLRWLLTAGQLRRLAR